MVSISTQLAAGYPLTSSSSARLYYRHRPLIVNLHALCPFPVAEAYNAADDDVVRFQSLAVHPRRGRLSHFFDSRKADFS